MVERLSPKYGHRYINTETNEHYEDFVRDEQVVKCKQQHQQVVKCK